MLVQSVLNILICVHYLPYFLEKRESEEIQATKIFIVHIQYQVDLKFNDTLFQMPICDFHIFIISSKSYRRCKRIHCVSHEN